MPDPKAEIKRLSRADSSSPRYSPANDNPRIACHLDLKRIAAKCPSFLPLRDFVRGPAPA